MKGNTLGKCEFCGNEKELGDSTPFHGFYCADCMRMNIEYDKQSISKMKPKRRREITKQEFERLEKEKNEALSVLMNFRKRQPLFYPDGAGNFKRK